MRLLVKVGLAIILMAIINATVATVLEIKIEPWWKSVVYDAGHVVMGVLIAIFVFFLSLRREVRKQVEDLKAGCTHPACLKKQNFKCN